MRNAGFNEQEREKVQFLWTRAWWTFVILGLIALALGVFALVNPQATATIPVRLLGAFIVLDGLFKVGTAVWERRYRWGARLAGGLVEMGIGIAVFVLSFDITRLFFTTVLYLVGFGFLLAGGFTILRAVSGHTGWQEMLLGLLKLGFGVVLFTLTGATAVVLVWLTGAFLLVVGGGLLFVGFRMRLMGRQLKQAMYGEVVDGVIIEGDVANAPADPLTVIQLPERTER